MMGSEQDKPSFRQIDIGCVLNFLILNLKTQSALLKSYELIAAIEVSAKYALNR